MQDNHYGGEAYPANQIVINEDDIPEFNSDGSIASFYDFNNFFWRASDVETRYRALKAEAENKPVTIWLCNLASEKRASVKADYEQVRATGDVTLRALWGERHRVSTLKTEPEIESLLVHDQDYLREVTDED